VRPEYDNAERWQPPGPRNARYVGNFAALLALSLATGLGEGVLGMVVARWLGVPAVFVPTYGVVIGVTLGLVSLFVLTGGKARGGDAARGLGLLLAKVQRFAAEHGLRVRVVRDDNAEHAVELRRVERQVRMSLRTLPAMHDPLAA
jgi:hypothetical protein